MRIHDTGKSASAPAALPDMEVDAQSSAPANRRPRARTLSPQERRRHASHSPSPDADTSLAGPEEIQHGFHALPLDILYKIRAALEPNAAARMAETSKSMLAIFQPRADADQLRHHARHPSAGILADNGGHPAQLASHFIHLMSAAGRQRLPEDLLPPVLNEIMQQASQQMAANSIHIEHVAHAYLLQVEGILDRRCKRASLCNFGRLLETPRLRRQCVPRGAPDTPRQMVQALAKRFSMLCLTMNAESNSPAAFQESAVSSVRAADGVPGVRRTGHAQSEKPFNDCVAMNAALTSAVFMLPVPQRMHVWRLLMLECAHLPPPARLPLLRGLCDMAARVGTTADASEAMLRSVQTVQSHDAATRAMLLGHLSAALQASPDRDLKDRGTVFLLAETNRLEPQCRPDLLVQLIRAIPSISGREKEQAFDLVLSQVFELTRSDQRRVLTGLYHAMRLIPFGAARLAAFDQLWKILPDADPGFAHDLRKELIHQIRTLPAHVRPGRFFEAVGDAGKLPGPELSEVLPYLLSNVATLGRPAVATAGFSDVAAMVRHQPIAWQTSKLRTLYDFVGRVVEPELACTFLTLLDRIAAQLDDRERVFLMGTATARAAWLPEPMFSDQLGTRVAQAKALAPSMRDLAYVQIVEALKNALEAPAVATDVVRNLRLETIVSRIGALPLPMRVPLLVSATRVLDRMAAGPARDRMGERIVADARELPSGMRMQLKQSLAAADCRYLFGYL